MIFDENSGIEVRFGNYSDKDDMIKDCLVSLGISKYILTKTPKGAPEIFELNDDGTKKRGVWISITHSYSQGQRNKTAKAAIAVSLNCPIGIDMESCNRKIGIRPNRILSQKEMEIYTAVEQLKESNKKELQGLMVTFWTIKEAMLKARGTGITSPLAKCCSIRAIERRKVNMFRVEDFIVALYVVGQ